ncbi:hypothetical protein [Desulfoscipio gibsoniae]|uniref:hypothetical protein n=1 Tax=Desulfoscipio gibsoniae TaxID=102134 RepID=UPI0002F2282D|nr:hypothetical protein [Desulfoscipio gibsoniae]
MLPTGQLYLDNISLLVKPEVAQKQIEEEKRKREEAAAKAQGGPTYTINPGGKTSVHEPDRPETGDGQGGEPGGPKRN